MKRLLTIWLCSMMLIAVSMGQNVKELQRQHRQLQQQLEETSKMLKQTKKKETATENKLSLLKVDIQTRGKLIGVINGEIREINNEMTTLGRKRDKLQQDLEACKQDYARLVRETHYSDMLNSPLYFLLSSENFQQMLRRARYMQEFAAYRKQQAQKIVDLQHEIDIKNNLLEDRRDDKQRTLKVQQQEQDKLARDQRKHKQMLGDLKKKEKDLLAKQKKQQQEANALNKKIEGLISKQVKSTTTMTKEQKLLSGDFEANQGRLPWPVEKGFISGFFGKHQHPIHEHVTVDNRGIYLQTVANMDARAVFDGEVTWCAPMNGNFAVIVQHGNYRTVYSPLKKIYVKQGDKVKSKQAIGQIFTDTDNDNKTELYFQIYKDKQILNPGLWLAQ